MDSVNFKSRSKKYQYCATLLANILTFGFGSSLGWVNPALPLLQSADCPLESGPVTEVQMSWIGSILPLGAVIGNTMIGYTTSIIGSKASITLLGIPQICAWLLMIFGTQVTHLYAARFLGGFVGGGIQTGISLFSAEIVDNDIRGSIGTAYQFLRCSGLLFAFVIVSYLDYFKLSMIFIGLTVIFLFTFFWLPSTPQYLLLKNKVQEAEKSFAFYKGFGSSEKSESYLAEFERLKAVSLAVKEEPTLAMKDIFNRNAMKLIIPAIIFPLLHQLCGAFVILTYGTKMVEQSAGSSLSMETATILMGIAQLVGSALAAKFVDSIGRKVLLVISFVGCAAGYLTMILYLYLLEGGVDTSSFDWLPTLCMVFIIFTSSVGIISIMLVCLVELFPIKLRSFGMVLGVVTMNISSFFILNQFLALTRMIQLQGCLLIFGFSCIFGAGYVVFFVNETKGKDLNFVKNENEQDTKSAA